MPRRFAAVAEIIIFAIWTASSALIGRLDCWNYTSIRLQRRAKLE
jgi:hypothetical protein